MAANPYTSARAPDGFTQLIAPDIAAQQQQLARQQQLADMLRQQSMSDDGGTQVIDGWAVQKSPFEGLAKLGQAYFGKKMQDNIDAKNLQLSKDYASVMADKLNHPPGSTPLSVAPADAPTTSSPVSIDPTVDNAARMDASVASGAPRAAALAQALSGQTAAPSAPVQSTSSPAPTNNFDMGHLQYAALLNGLSPQMANAYAKQFEAPDQQRLDSYLGVSAAQRRDLNLAAARKEGTQSLIPGQTNVLPDGSRIVAPNFETGVAGGFGPDGAPTVSAIAGAADAKSGITRATTQAEVQARDAGALPTQVELKAPTMIPGVGMVQPGVYMLTPSQQRSIANGGTDSLYPASPTAGQMPGHPITGLSTDRAISTIRDPQQRSNVVAALGQPGSSGLLQVPSAADVEASKARAVAGVTQDTKPGLDYSTGAAQSFQKMGDNINSHVSESQALLQRIAQSRDALARFQSGGGAEVRAQLAQYAQAIPGMPQGVVDRLAGGDLSAVQEFQKFAAQEALQTMQQSLSSDSGPQAKGNRISMELFIKNNPNITTDPRAIEKIFNFQTDLHNDALRQSDFYSDYVKQNRGTPGALDASVFANKWAHKQIDDGRVVPQQVTGQAMGTKVRKFDAATGTFH